MITAASFLTSKPEFKFFYPVSKKRYQRIKKELGNYQIFYSGYDKNEDLFTVFATSDKSRSHYYLYDAIKDRLTFLVDVSPWLKSDQLASMKPWSISPGMV